MVAIFAFDGADAHTSRNRASPQHNTQRFNLPTQFEKEWPRLGGSAPPALKPSWGLRASPQPAATTTLTADRISPRAGMTSGTAKGGLAMLLANSRPSSRTPSDAGDIAAERAEAELSPSRGRKKKNKNKKSKAEKRDAGISTAGLEKPDFLLPRTLKASPSTGSLRANFISSTPRPAGKPDSEYTWELTARGETSSSSSVSSSPPRSGFSSFLGNAHPGDIVTVAGTETPASSDNGEEDDRESVVAYEVAIDEDYISKDVDSRTGSRTASPARKKMTVDDFEPLKCLGKGAFGTVLLVRHKASGRLYAQKQMKKASIVIHKRVVEQTITERSILESVRHPNVVKLYYAFQDHEKLYLILEYAQGGELFLHLAETWRFSEDTAAYYIAQLVLALSHLHLNVGVVYRDLKPENCLLDHEGQLLLTDFGLSKVSSEGSRCSSLLGTPGYMAPEVLCDDGSEYGAAVDWWGVGILSYELLTGKLPFEGSTPMKVRDKIQKRKVQMPPYLSADAKDFITRLLRKQPHKRLGYNLVQDLPIIKKHRFFRKIDWVKLEARELTPPIQPLVTDPVLAENFSSEFTDLPLSPLAGHGFPASFEGKVQAKHEDDPFGGFSFVATSLLEQEFGWASGAKA